MTMSSQRLTERLLRVFLSIDLTVETGPLSLSAGKDLNQALSCTLTASEKYCDYSGGYKRLKCYG